MRIVYLDGFSGISGDMFLGALVDAGVSFELLQQTVAALHIDAALEMSRVDRNGISAIKIDVLVDGQKDLPREEFWVAEQAHSHDGASHGHDLAGGEEPGYSHSRHLGEILKIISAAPISGQARHTASAIFTALGEAEAKVHNVDIEAVHFHEVGAADAIADIVCAAVGAEALQVGRFLASPLNVGGGTVICSHGEMPIPAPATLELLKGCPVYSGEVQKELITPTGAAIVRVLATSFGPRPLMTTEKIGYGAGARDFAGHSNVLRLTVGETLEAGSLDTGANQNPIEEIVVLEANLDDLSPQIIGYVADRLLSEGALDVFTTAVQMKKARPGTLLTVLAKPQHEQTLRNIVLSESSTLGIRSRRENRHVLARRHEIVQTPWGEVRIKVASMAGTDSQFAPEYEDCRRIATENHVPLKTVMQEALRLYLDKKHG
jgi:pyridinium-3,5-bisthiocarboxylic acid mononucleotide nickel chelatase